MMKKNKDSDLTDSEKLISLFAWALVITGIIVGVVFLARLPSSATVTNDISLSASGQFGDYIGGVLGALWTLAGVLFFYLTLTIQRRELRLYREELTGQTREFAATRIVNIIYQQTDFVDQQLNQIKGNSSRYGAAAIQELKYRWQNTYKYGTANVIMRAEEFRMIDSQEFHTYVSKFSESVSLIGNLISQKDSNNNQYIFDEPTQIQLTSLTSANLPIHEVKETIQILGCVNDYYETHHGNTKSPLEEANRRNHKDRIKSVYESYQKRLDQIQADMYAWRTS